MSAVIAQALREYGDCFRHDWSDYSIDGRGVKQEMYEVADALESDTEKPIEWWRMELGMCPKGDGHWTTHCTDGCAS